MSETRSTMLNMGPAHPSMHGVVRLVLELEGERVQGAEAHIGYLHRAFEKHAENEPYNNVIPWTDRLNYVSPLINNVGYCLAVEKLAGLQPPERAQYLRVVACELSRITDHLTCIGATAMELGAFTVFLYMMKAREWVYQAIDKLTGARVTTAYTRVGGVKADMPQGFAQLLRDLLPQVRGVLKEVDALLTKNRIFVDRMSGTGLLPRDLAIDYGITGPMLRGSGVPYDVRRALPYCVYDRLDFDIPVGGRGDNFDRYLVRMAEMEQSMRLLSQCLEQLPPGPPHLSGEQLLAGGVFADMGKAGRTADLCKREARVDPVLDGSGRSCQPLIQSPSPACHLPSKEEAYGSIEGLMRHFEIIMWGRGISPPAGEAYAAVEGGNGELGFYVVSDGTDRPYRVRVRPPCFFNMAALPELLKGGTLADIVPTFGSINMIAGELDR